MRFDEKEAEKARDGLRATIEEIAKAKGITFEEALRRCIAIVETMVLPGRSPEPPPPPPPAIARGAIEIDARRLIEVLKKTRAPELVQGRLR